MPWKGSEGRIETMGHDPLARLDNKAQMGRQQWKQQLVKTFRGGMQITNAKARNKRMAKVVRQALAARQWNKLCATLLDVAGKPDTDIISTIKDRQVQKYCTVDIAHKKEKEGGTPDSMDELDHEEALCTRLVVDTLAIQEKNTIAGRLDQASYSATMDLNRRWEMELEVVNLPFHMLEEANLEMEQELRRQLSTGNCLLQWCKLRVVASSSFREDLENFVNDNFTLACEEDSKGMKMLTWEDWRRQAAYRKGKEGMGYSDFVHFIQWIYEDAKDRKRYLLPAFSERLICLDRMSMAELEQVDGEPLVYADERCLQLVAAAYLALFCSEYTGI